MKLKTLLLTLLLSILSIGSINTSFANGHYAGKYCEIEGAYTSNGKLVQGEGYFYSDRHGELEGAYTEDGIPVNGELYRYSGRYAEFDGVYTSNGESVSGECYIY